MALTLAPPFAASVDRLRAADAPLALQAALVVGTALLTGLLAQFELRIYLWEVPLTLQTLAVYGAGLVLGGRNGFLAMALYLAAGLVLPVFAGGASGLGYLMGSASAGYLLAYPVVALLIGRLTDERRGFLTSAAGMMLGVVLLFTVGVIWLHVAAGHATWGESILKGALLFIVWDLAKVWLVAGGYAGLRRIA